MTRARELATNHRQAFIRGLRELADLLEDRPQLPVPFPAGEGSAHIQTWLLGGDARERFDTAARTLGVAPRPSPSGAALQLERRLGATDVPVIGLTYAVVVSSGSR